ncbi:MAG: copper amine oxidase N-terminal domain-containing protein [Eubacteriales bacterium]|nr:copper amine oxidase N-terminal domain-containing protein [Eubacteriales bacterium]
MKKIFLITFIMVLALNFAVSAFADVLPSAIESNVKGYMEYDSLEKINLSNSSYSIHVAEINGETFVLYKNQYYKSMHPVPFDEQVQIALYGYDYVKAGDYYFARSCRNDNAPESERTNFLVLLDENFQVIKSHNFATSSNEDNVYGFNAPYIEDIGYFGGKYYCSYWQVCREVIGEDGEVEYLPYMGSYRYPDIVDVYRTLVSEDMENWTVISTDTEVNLQNIPRVNPSVAMLDKAVSFDKNTLYDVIPEQDAEKEYARMYGNWFLTKDDDENFYLSNDNVYFAKINMEQYADTIRDCEVNIAYEEAENIIIDVRKRREESSWYDYHKIYIPKSEVYSVLENLKNAMYVKLNDNILGFEQPPVVEDDRTLVPMRFLFEQMGADVNWNEQTQTAKVSQNNETISFSIDEKNAKVNNATVTMDVPARLINDKTMVPLRFLSEELGYTVTWDEETNTASITTTAE